MPPERPPKKPDRTPPIVRYLRSKRISLSAGNSSKRAKTPIRTAINSLIGEITAWMLPSE